MNIFLKYLAGAALIGSVFFLVYEGKVSVEIYLTMVGAALGALGVYGSRPGTGSPDGGPQK
jgi:VIT1/CCC1 family predicted Fe2+/Mn2+ transporter